MKRKIKTALKKTIKVVLKPLHWIRVLISKTIEKIVELDEKINKW